MGGGHSSPTPASALSPGLSSRVPSLAGLGPIFSSHGGRCWRCSSPGALGWPRTPSPVFSLQRSCPRRSHRLGCLGGFWEGGGIKYLFYRVFWQQQVLTPGRVSALLEGDVGDPLVVLPALFAVTGNLHQAVAFPGVCVRVLWEGEETGFSGSPRSGWGAPLSQGPFGESRLAQNSSLGD